MMNKEDGKLAQLTETYEKLKKLGMGEEVLAPLRKEIQGLGGDADEPHQVDIRGGVHTGGGDFVARDKIVAALAAGSIAIGGDANGNIFYINAAGENEPLGSAEQAGEIFLDAYYRLLAEECSHLPFGIVDAHFAGPRAQGELRLDDVYTDLDVVSPLRREDEDKYSFGMRLARGEEGERTPLLEAISESQHPYLVLLGDPGSGKTTFINYLVYQLVNGDEEMPGVLQGKPVIRLVLRNAATHIPADNDCGDPQMLWAAVRANLDKALGKEIGEMLNLHLMKRIASEGCVLLLDGLDEVPEASRRRRCLMEAVQKLVSGLKAGSRVILTARPYAYADPEWCLEKFQNLTLAPFSEKQVQRFVQSWYHAVGPKMDWSMEAADLRAGSLAQALEERQYLGDLASRPLLLTLIATMHTSGGQLPQDRAELYEETVKLLLTRWERKRTVVVDGKPLEDEGITRALGIGEPALRRALETLAYAVHQRQWKEKADGDEKHAADISWGEVVTAFANILDDDTHPRVLLRYLEQRSGLLICREEGTYAFPHRSFQEYLAACHLAGQPNFATHLKDLVFADPAWWREVFLLAAGKKKRGGMEGAVNAVHTLLPKAVAEMQHPTDAHWLAATLAGDALLELRLLEEAQGEEVYETQIEHTRQWLTALVEGGKLNPRQRVEAGDVLGRLGDWRKGVNLIRLDSGKELPDIAWVEIPAGGFLMGSTDDDKQAYEWEKKQHPLDLPAYWIGRYPLTNQQYGLFLAAGGYEEQRFWTDEGWAWRQGAEADLSPLDDHKDEDFKKRYKEWLAQRTKEKRAAPWYWQRTPWNGANRPVVGVCWYEALAYCRWLTEQLKAQGVEGLPLQEDFKVELPSEAQWEKAVRRAEGNIYPWGKEWQEDAANTEKAGLKETSPVGIFPGGRSETYGLLDGAGNVWEWTRSRWGKKIMSVDYGYPYDAADGREEMGDIDLRVVRGGSWLSSERYARCAFRDGRIPDIYYDALGFRIVLSPDFPLRPPEGDEEGSES
jgi:formylglycine-generating enzyme required for sulfatase activity